jgi:hypothetical protein
MCTNGKLGNYPTVQANGKRIPGLKLDHARDLALMSALVRFCYVVAAIPSPPPNCRWEWRRRLPLLPTSALSAQYAMNCRSSAAKDWWKNSPIPAAIGYSRLDIGSAWCSSNCSTKSMHRSPPASFIPIGATELYTWGNFNRRKLGNSRPALTRSRASNTRRRACGGINPLRVERHQRGDMLSRERCEHLLLSF